MSRKFVSASSQHLVRTATVPMTAYPVSLSVMFRGDSLTSVPCLVGLSEVATDTALASIQVGSDGKAYGFVSGAGANNSATSAASAVVAGTWQVITATFDGTDQTPSEIKIYVDGSLLQTDNTGTADPAVPTRIGVGALIRGTPVNYTDGSIAEVAIWNAVLTPTEVASLGTGSSGWSPAKVATANLVAYYRLADGDNDEDRVGTFDLTASGSPTYSTDPVVNYTRDIVLKDRVQETSTTTGTGTLTLAGAVTKYRSFADVGDGAIVPYVIEHATLDEWEVGYGTYTASGTTLTREFVVGNSSGGKLPITLSAGTKNVFVGVPADLAAALVAQL